MDNNNNFIMTSTQSCLHSFFSRVAVDSIDTSTSTHLSLSNSPSKLVEAGFERTQQSRNNTGISDEVQCKSCGLKYSGWSVERPLAVHRTLSPKCSFLNTPPSSNNNNRNMSTIQNENHRNSLRNVRRQLFAEYDTLASQMDDYPDIQHPFVPKRGDFLMLFESFRLLTFQDPTCVEAAVFAKCGFVFDSNSLNAACVFCNQEVEFRTMKLIELEFLHEESRNCPFVKEYDVGNVSCEEERQIKEKVRNEMHAHHHTGISNTEFFIRHPEYEGMESRVGTFSTWPVGLSFWGFDSDITMAECGFYYTGFRDSVKCFCCGIGLCNWTPGADPCSQHAKASPECFYIRKLKGQEFVNVSNSVQLTVQVEYREESSIDYSSDSSDSSDSDSSMSTASSASSCSSSPCSPTSQVGLPHLDMDAIKPALCQYTIQKIANAVSNFFLFSNGRYPNSVLLMGALRAGDENYTQVCQKTQELIIKDRVIEDQGKEIVKKTKRETKLKTELARAKDTLEWTDERWKTELQHVQRKNETLRQTDKQREKMLEKNREMLDQKDEMLEQNRLMLEMKNKQIEDLQLQFQSLSSAHNSQPQQSFLDEAAAAPVSVQNPVQVEEFPIASCKVCMCSKAQVMFLPCKHMCCCVECAAKLYKKGCPICRTENSGLEKVYVI